MAGEIYDAVTRCLRCWIHSSAAAVWNVAGSRLHGFVRPRPNTKGCCALPNNNICFRDQGGNDVFICHVDNPVLDVEMFFGKFLSFNQRVAC